MNGSQCPKREAGLWGTTCGWEDRGTMFKRNGVSGELHRKKGGAEHRGRRGQSTMGITAYINDPAVLSNLS